MRTAIRTGIYNPYPYSQKELERLGHPKELTEKQRIEITRHLLWQGENHPFSKEMVSSTSDKGKGKMAEPEKKSQRSGQVRLAAPLTL
ncbi:unnamed protein product [Calypogeia fissa]